MEQLMPLVDALWESPLHVCGTFFLSWMLSVTAWRLVSSREPPRSHPLASWPVPIVGNILNAYVFFTEFAKLDKEKPWNAVLKTQEQVGRTFRFPFMFETAYTIVGKEGLKIGLSCKTEDGERVLGIQKLPSIQNIWGKYALSNTDIGEQRDKIKRLMHPTLAPKALQAYLVDMHKDIDNWMKMNLENLPAHGVLKMYQPVRELTMVIPVRMVLGLGEEAQETVDRTRHLAIAMWDGTVAPPLAFLGGAYSKGIAARQEIIPIIRELIAKRRKEQEEKKECGIDMLSQLVRASDELGKLTEEEIIDQVIVIFLAGYETSVSLIATAFHYLAMPQYAHVLAKLRAEQQKYPGNVSYSDVMAMSYLRNFFYECLRVFPPVAQFGKTVVKSFQFDGYTIPKGATFMYQVAASQRDSVEDPDTIIPERHDDPDSPLNKPYGFTPFAGNEFLCPGKGFVMLEAALLVRRVIMEFDFEHASERPAIQLSPVFLRPTDDQPLRFTPRNSQSALADVNR